MGSKTGLVKGSDGMWRSKPPPSGKVTFAKIGAKNLAAARSSKPRKGKGGRYYARDSDGQFT